MIYQKIYIPLIPVSKPRAGKHGIKDMDILTILEYKAIRSKNGQWFNY